MYTITVSDGKRTATKRCRAIGTARNIARLAANAGHIYYENVELHKEQRLMEVKTVRITDKVGNDIDF